MSRLELFTAEVFQVPRERQASTKDDKINNNNQLELFNEYKLLKCHPNMTSARVIRGKMIELEQSSLIAQPVKFKTVINFSRFLDPGSSLGVILKPQESYISSADNQLSET